MSTMENNVTKKLSESQRAFLEKTALNGHERSPFVVGLRVALDVHAEKDEAPAVEKKHAQAILDVIEKERWDEERNCALHALLVDLDLPLLPGRNVEERS